MENRTLPPDGHTQDDNTIVVKKEPEAEPMDSIEANSDPGLLDLPENTTAGHTEPHRDDDFHNNLMAMLHQFHANSTPERDLSCDSDLEKATAAVEQKQVEIALAESQGRSTLADRIALEALRNTANRIQKRWHKGQDHPMQDSGDQSMFYSDEDDDDDKDYVRIIPAPGVSQAREVTTFGDFEITDDSESREELPQSVREEDNKASNRAKKDRKARKETSTSRVQKRGSDSRKGVQGGRHDRRMLNIGSLLRNDIVADAHANQGAGEQPSFKGLTTKRGALDALIASIPKENRNVTRGERTALENAAKRFRWRGRGSMQVKEDGWRLKGMRTSLKNYQLLSAAWGCDREAGDNPPYGGILADTMGYGKTLQMITIMVENQPKLEKKNQTTLIVVPSSIVRQWEEEIAKHTEDTILNRVMVWKSGSRIDTIDIVAALQSYPIVITTYQEVMRNYPKCEPPIHLVTDKAKDEWWDKYYHAEKGPLLKMPFFRIILDEAQIIKNHMSRTSKACRLLTAKYKWVISGTPLSNCMEELFSYFSFLGVEGAATYAQFKTNYGRRNDTSMQRLDAILRTVMVRRTGADRLLGKPLITLPALDHQTIEVAFNSFERAIYSVVRQRFIRKINDWSASKQVGQISKNILVMLLRLRQMCSHVLIVAPILRQLLEADDIESLWNAMQRHSQVGSETGTKTAKVIQKILQKALDEHQSSNADKIQVPSANNQASTIDLTIDDSGIDYHGIFNCFWREGAWDDVRGRSHCRACKGVPTASIKLAVPCGHLYCEGCLQALLESAKEAGVNAICCECQNPMTGAANMTAFNHIENEPEYLHSRSLPRAKKMKEEGISWPSIAGAESLSTKVQAITSTLEKWIEEDAEAKIVIFTLFLPIVKVFAKICSRKRWGYQEYTGAMSIRSREQALKKFKDPEKGNRVFLMSMRAGGLGLNLTEASYVVITDPWWNTPAEDQAFSRTYRLGQERDCVVRKFVIKDTIETELMLRLQEVKAAECDRIIDGRKQDTLEIEDLMKLFGPTRRDPRTGELVIGGDGEDADYEYDEFVMGDDHIVIDCSDVEEVSAAPSRLQE